MYILIAVLIGAIVLNLLRKSGHIKMENDRALESWMASLSWVAAILLVLFAATKNLAMAMVSLMFLADLAIDFAHFLTRKDIERFKNEVPKSLEEKPARKKAPAKPRTRKAKSKEVK